MSDHDSIELGRIEVRGEDATDFLQAQLTADLATDPLLAAWCDHRGRVRAVLRPRIADAGWDLELPASIAQEILEAARKRLPIRRALALRPDRRPGCRRRRLPPRREGREARLCRYLEPAG